MAQEAILRSHPDLKQDGLTVFVVACYYKEGISWKEYGSKG